MIASDTRSKGMTEDRVGPLLREMLEPIADVVSLEIVPDDVDSIAQALVGMSDDLQVDLVLTSGGTGFAPRDVTPEATMQIATKLVPGFAEEMRRVSIAKTPHGMLSRAISVIRNQTLIINMPGSPKAVKECLEAIMPAIPHALETLRGESGSRPEDHRYKNRDGLGVKV